MSKKTDSFVKGLWISFGGLAIALLPFIEQGLVSLKESESVELATTAVIVSNILNLVRIWLKTDTN
jgi:hypothetical protein